MIGKIKATWNATLAEGRARADRYLGARPHRSFRPTPKYKYKKGRQVAGMWPLVKGSFQLIWKERTILIGLMLLSALALFVFVGGIPTLSFADLRRSINEIFTGDFGQIGAAWTLFNSAVTGSLNSATSPLQQFLAGLISVIFWLTYIWALRHLLADKPQPIKIRDALYNSGSPLVSSAMVFLAAVVQLIPAALGSFGMALVLSGQWLNGAEAMAFCAAAALLCLLSIYWVVSSLIALVVVTVPGMYPWRALAGSSVLVIGQRWAIALRVVLLVVLLYVIWAVVLIPMLLLDNWLKFDYLPIITFTVQLLGAFTIMYASVYMYKLYRSML
ncbi:MAG TPA: hypothetical protein VLA88_02230 [Candidatus Saccharimonadales bacterium]|nr:hypothetical protein [Candidatus Saccharimonadales bacterium]